MAQQEKMFNVSVSVMPASVADVAAKSNGVVTVQMAVNETAFGDSRSHSELKATYHRVTPEAADAVFKSLSPILGTKHDQTADQIAKIKSEVASALAALDHTKAA